MDYGKYQYLIQKKEKVKKAKPVEIKVVRITPGISVHDLEFKCHLAEKFLKEGNKAKIEMILRGREKALENFAKEKIKHFLEILEKMIPIEIEKELKKEQKGLAIIVAKKTIVKND